MWAKITGYPWCVSVLHACVAVVCLFLIFCVHALACVNELVNINILL